VTSALCGIAETGTLMLVSGEQNPTSLNFLPDYHIVVLRSDQLVPRMEDAWDTLRASFAQMPRTVNFISGPSKTADVEQTVEYGAHGPRCLHVVLVG
jgi:L-lactate utilization protein LutC